MNNERDDSPELLRWHRVGDSKLAEAVQLGIDLRNAIVLYLDGQIQEVNLQEALKVFDAWFVENPPNDSVRKSA